MAERTRTGDIVRDDEPNPDAVIVVNGIEVGRGIEGMLAALAILLSPDEDDPDE